MKKTIFLIGLVFFVAFSTYAQKLSEHGGAGYRLKRIFQVEGRQGIAADEDFYYVSCSKALYKYDKTGKLLLSNKAPFKDFEKEVNHFGDIDVFNGEIITGVEFFDAGNVRNIQIAIYDAASLKYKRSIFFEGMEQPEVCGIGVDKQRKIAWMADWTQGNYIYKYDLEKGIYLGKLSLQPSPHYQQGIYYIDGKVLITADDGDADNNDADNIYIADISDLSNTATQVSLFMQVKECLKHGEIEGLTIDPVTDELLVMSNRGRIIHLGMPKGYYEGYTEEIHDIYVYEKIK